MTNITSWCLFMMNLFFFVCTFLFLVCVTLTCIVVLAVWFSLTCCLIASIPSLHAVDRESLSFRSLCGLSLTLCVHASVLAHSELKRFSLRPAKSGKTKKWQTSHSETTADRQLRQKVSGVRKNQWQSDGRKARPQHQIFWNLHSSRIVSHTDHSWACKMVVRHDQVGIGAGKEHPWVVKSCNAKISLTLNHGDHPSAETANLRAKAPATLVWACARRWRSDEEYVSLWASRTTWREETWEIFLP